MKDSRLILDDLNYDRLVAYFQRYLPGVQALVYGSRVGGKPRRYSDIDIVTLTGKEQAIAVSKLRDTLDESNIPYRVDLWEWNKTPESWREKIQRDGVLLY
jgi:predicted nucleotidyltransferase